MISAKARPVIAIFAEMKKIYTQVSVVFLTVFSAFTATAQISVYYNSALDLADEDLKEALHNIIDGNQFFPYSSGGTDTWDILKQADRDPENAQNVIQIYTGRSVNGPQEFNNGNGWNREHVWPRSRGAFDTSTGIGTDVHNLKPSDIDVNQARGNRVFANCIDCTEVISDGLATGSFLDNTNGTFEPRDAVKGDVARILFYMAVRYEGDGDPNLTLVDNLLPQGSSTPFMALLGDLLEWNAEDPVDEFETNRNEVIFDFQGNRNPFIDHPELAEHLWGDLQGFTWPFTVSTHTARAAEPLRVFPNPAHTEIRLNASFEQALIYDLRGRTVGRYRGNRTMDISNLTDGLYLLQVERTGLPPEVLKLTVH